MEFMEENKLKLNKMDLNKKNKMIDLTIEEMLLIDGGHKGVAYQIGHAIGEAANVIGTAAGFVALFLMPKS